MVENRKKMIQTNTANVYSAECDICKTDFEHPYEGWTVFLNEDMMLDSMANSGWHNGDEGCLCPKCHHTCTQCDKVFTPYEVTFDPYSEKHIESEFCSLECFTEWRQDNREELCN